MCVSAYIVCLSSFVCVCSCNHLSHFCLYQCRKYAHTWLLGSTAGQLPHHAHARQHVAHRYIHSTHAHTYKASMRQLCIVSYGMEYCIGFIQRVGYLHVPCIPEVDSPSSLELEIVHKESIVKCSYWNKSDSTPPPLPTEHQQLWFLVPYSFTQLCTAADVFQVYVHVAKQIYCFLLTFLEGAIVQGTAVRTVRLFKGIVLLNTTLSLCGCFCTLGVYFCLFFAELQYLFFVNLPFMLHVTIA